MSATPPSAAGPHPVLRAGQYAWAVTGVVVCVVLLALLAGVLRLIIVPLVLALFPAAVLDPLARWLRDRGAPRAVAALAALFAGALVLAGVVGLIVPAVVVELPDLVDSFQQGVGELDALVATLPSGVGEGGVAGLVDQAGEAFGQGTGVLGGAVQAATAVVETVVAVLFGLVVLFFYLKDGERIGLGLASFAPASVRDDLGAVAGRVWWTLGAFFRGQLLVALVDALFIGVGLLLLGVPLAFPLAVLVFLGGLFPIVGAFVSGFAAVTVALADGGLTTALLVLALIVAVQQAESNVLEPVILSRAIRLHPLMVLVAITAGAVTLGVLGAFLAVPFAASVGAVVRYVREQQDAAGEAAQEPAAA